MKRDEDERAPVYERLADEVARAIKQELASPIHDLKMPFRHSRARIDEDAEEPHERMPLSPTYRDQAPYDPMLEDQDEGEQEEPGWSHGGIAMVRQEWCPCSIVKESA